MENLFQVGRNKFFSFHSYKPPLVVRAPLPLRGGLVAAGELKSCVPAHIDNVGRGF